MYQIFEKMKKHMEQYKNKNEVDWIEYIEAEPNEPFKLRGLPLETFTWGRITKSVTDIQHPLFRNTTYTFMSIIPSIQRSCGNSFVQGIDEAEYIRLKKSARKIKKITFSNPTVINLAKWAVGIAFFTLVFTTLANLDNIIENLSLLRSLLRFW